MLKTIAPYVCPRARVSMCPRLFLRLILRRFVLLPAFCKRCGRTVHDFSAPDWTWRHIRPLIKHGDVLCYDCFCELCAQKGLPSVWKLVEIEEREDA